MTRISSVFANAIFGALAVLFFSGALQHQIKDMPLSPNEKTAVTAQAADLGNATVPTNVQTDNKAKIEQAYHDSFINAYGKIMRLSAGLGFLGAFMSLLFIKNSTIKDINGK